MITIALIIGAGVCVILAVPTVMMHSDLKRRIESLEAVVTDLNPKKLPPVAPKFLPAACGKADCNSKAAKTCKNANCSMCCLRSCDCQFYERL